MVKLLNTDNTWEVRMRGNSALKEAVAKTVIRSNIISKFDHIFLDCGSTFVYLAKKIFALHEKLSPLTIYTTNAAVLSEYMALEQRDLFNLILIGGRYVPHHNAFDGKGFDFESDEHSLIDKAFIGVCPIDSKLKIFGSISDVIKIKQRVVNRSSEVIVLCDEKKFGEPQPGSRVVGAIDLLPDRTLKCSVGLEKERTIPARIVIGTHDAADHSKDFSAFLDMANSSGLLANSSVMLAKSG